MVTIGEYRMVGSLQEAYDLLMKSRNNAVIAGGMWTRMGKKHIRTAIDLSGLGLDAVVDTGEELVIGAMTPLRALETDAAASKFAGGVLAESVRSIVGVQFRNSATVGASVFAKYGFSDVVTALLALDTYVELFHAGTMSLAEYLTMKPFRDILVAVHIRKDGRKAAYMALRRTTTDFATLNVCVSVDPKGKHAVSVGARPMRAMLYTAAAEALDAGDAEQAKNAVRAMVYGSNLRGSAEYRRAMSAVLLERACAALKEG